MLLLNRPCCETCIAVRHASLCDKHSGLDENSPSVIGLRVSLTRVVKGLLSPSALIAQVSIRCARWSALRYSTRIASQFDFQSGQFDAVHKPERLAGRLAPSVLLACPHG